MTLLLLGGATTAPAAPGGAGTAGPFGSTLHIEWSPTTNPLDTPVWVDITEHVRNNAGVTITRGRSSELDEFQAGTATFTLNNRARLFDPSYTAGAYYGNLKVLRRFRIVVTYATVDYVLFTGFITGWPQTFEPSNREATVPVSLVDGFGLLALANLFDSGSFTLDSSTLGVLDEDRLGVSGDDAPTTSYSGDRADAVLDAAGFTQRNVEQGLSVVSSSAPTGELLAHLRQLEKSEDGFFYFAGDGTATFLGRSARQTVTRISTSQATFADDGTDYSSVAFSYDTERLYNDVRRTGTSGSEQAVEDSGSIGSYFRRTHSETLLVTEDAVARDLAAVFLDRYAEPAQRVPEITIPVGADPTVLMPAVLDRELLDRVTVTRTPQKVGSANTSEQLVEGIVHVFDSKQWTTRLQLSPGYITNYFTLDSSTMGVLDEDTLGG